MAEPIIKLDLREVESIPRLIMDIEAIGADVRKPLKRFGVFMESQTDKTFRDGGRGDVKWKPLAPMTLALRRWRGRAANPKRILQVTGTLRSSIKTQVRKTQGSLAMFLFTKVPYAGKHQFGGTVRTPRRVIVPRKKKVLRFIIGGREVFAKRVVQPAKTREIPKRMFLFFTSFDVDKSVELLAVHAAETGEEAVKKHKARRKK